MDERTMRRGEWTEQRGEKVLLQDERAAWRSEWMGLTRREVALTRQEGVCDTERGCSDTARGVCDTARDAPDLRKIKRELHDTNTVILDGAWIRNTPAQNQPSFNKKCGVTKKRDATSSYWLNYKNLLQSNLQTFPLLLPNKQDFIKTFLIA